MPNAGHTETRVVKSETELDGQELIDLIIQIHEDLIDTSAVEAETGTEYEYKGHSYEIEEEEYEVLLETGVAEELDLGELEEE